MKISIFGSGYVGLVQSAIFADVGHQVLCMDVDQQRIERLNKGELPFYEPGLEPLLRSGQESGLLSFTSDTQRAVEESDALFICVGTPSAQDGSADLSYVLQVATDIGRHMNERKLVVTKSTVPVGTAENVREACESALRGRGKHLEVDVASNPEFLKEGSAVSDGQKPDRIIIGTDSDKALADLRFIYQAFNRNHEKILAMDLRSAELTKYAANAFLATKISFMNEMANLAEEVGADIEEVRRGIGSDPRIGFQFIYPGCGYGGSCFPKDVRALEYLASEYGYKANIVSAVHETNRLQKEKLLEKLLRRFGADFTGMTFAVWGLSFKPNTDDIREAPSIALMDGIFARGGSVQAFDPQAGAACQSRYRVRKDLAIVDSKESALDGADCLLICTEWKAFWSPDFEAVKTRLKNPVIIDGRNLYDPVHMGALGIEYYAIGRGNPLVQLKEGAAL
ncbi:MAG: UDPglucose 6-dehydrogenase [Halieaceae bacterium]|jgi:UDPglucose 6-dehydrogenase